jgi:hypothetical protein
MAIDGESLRKEKFALDNGVQVEVTLKVKDIIYFRLLRELLINLEKMR